MKMSKQSARVRPARISSGRVAPPTPTEGREIGFRAPDNGVSIGSRMVQRKCCERGCPSNFGGERLSGQHIRRASRAAMPLRFEVPISTSARRSTASSSNAATRSWERCDSGWFIHTYRHVPAPLVRVLARTDGREVPIYGLAYYERVTTKQAGKKEIREARTLLQRDPLAGAE
jgi:hypothetical protein